jgi:hypothetical protein
MLPAKWFGLRLIPFAAAQALLTLWLELFRRLEKQGKQSKQSANCKRSAPSCVKTLGKSVGQSGLMKGNGDSKPVIARFACLGCVVRRLCLLRPLPTATRISEVTFMAAGSCVGNLLPAAANERRLTV